MQELNPQVQLALMLVVVMLLPVLLILIVRLYRKRMLRREAEALMRGNKIYSEWRANKQP